MAILCQELRPAFKYFNLVAALNFLKDKAKAEIVVLGVEPEEIDYGLELTPAATHRRGPGAS